MPLIKLNKKLVRCNLFHKKLGLQSLHILIFTLLRCAETLLIPNLVQTHHTNLILTLSIFFGECE